MKKVLVVLMLMFSGYVDAQETLPVYSDYLSDNVFLIHPSAAGIGNTGKIRLTARNQWSGVDDAPELQTFSFHSRVGENTGLGLVIFNDKNGYHSQQGVQGTFAYHLNVGRLGELNQLSFGLSFMAVNNSVDESQFTIPDPVISQIIRSESYFNADFSMAYHRNRFFSYFTAKNIMLSARTLYNDKYESLNLRRYLATVGYFTGREEGIQLEPSIMGQIIERTGEKFVDFNIKAYKKFGKAQLWVALSYRQGFDGNDTQELSYITPIVGLNMNDFMLSYTYTKLTGDILFDDAGYHQVTLGLNVFKRPAKRQIGCPNIYNAF
ncbi:MAG: hypothetical protein COB98_02265 [Flavobacteriaceae bacterium]|nr:MAG: hypothetical protein COB98_02265 [Flavobacteriaceae bacterium]